MATLRLRCKTEEGTCVIQPPLLDSASLEELMKSIESLTKIKVDSQKILVGFPPKCVDTLNRDCTLKSLLIKSGDTLNVVNKDKSCSQHSDAVNVTKVPTVKRNEVPADNSCLFYSVFYVTKGYLNYDEAKELRVEIARAVLSRPDKYSMAVLGKSPSDYGVWIQSDTSWGGAIELSILSEIFSTEIAAIDTKTKRIDIYGQDAGYSSRVFLVYDGIHYDPLYLDSKINGVPPQTVFSTTDDIMLTKVCDFGESANKARQYTDTANFTLRCLTCQIQLKGQSGAQAHAKETGHGNFGEI